MTFEIEVTGVNLAPRTKWDRPLTIAAFCDVRLSGLSTTLFGVALARSKGKWVALPPKAAGARPNDPGVIKWDLDGPVPRGMAEAMLERYVAFGGPMPPEPTKSQERDTNAARRVHAKEGEIERRVLPFTLTAIDGRPQDEWIAGIEAELARMPVNQPDDDEPGDSSGVLRFIGKDPVIAETLDRAGL